MTPKEHVLTRIFLAAVFCFAALPSLAAPFDRVRPVYDLLGMPELMEVMRDEGLSHGTSLEDQLFARRGGEEWGAIVGGIYDEARMETKILEGLDAELEDGELSEIKVFFESDLGRHIVSLEVSARRALLDEAVEEQATNVWLGLQEENGKRWQLLEEFVESNDLIELNVAGAMTSNYAFFRGLVDGQAFDFVMTEQDILADVWGQEAEIRSETKDWVYSFSALAYQPLSDDELQAYLDFAQSPAGKAMNSALFVVFNELFTETSHQLGLGAAHFMAGDDI